MKTMNYSLIRILFALVIGLVLVIWPNAAASYIVITVGVAFLIPGVISLFGYFGRKRPEGEAAPRFPIEGIGSLLFGLWLIVMPEFFADVLMFLLGFILRQINCKNGPFAYFTLKNNPPMMQFNQALN